MVGDVGAVEHLGVGHRHPGRHPHLVDPHPGVAGGVGEPLLRPQREPAGLVTALGYVTWIGLAIAAVSMVWLGVLIAASLRRGEGALIKAGNRGKLGFFASIKDAKFRKQVRPGDVLELESRIVKTRRSFAFVEAEARVDGEVACTATLTLALGSADEA